MNGLTTLVLRGGHSSGPSRSDTPAAARYPSISEIAGPDEAPSGLQSSWEFVAGVPTSREPLFHVKRSYAVAAEVLRRACRRK